MSIFSCYTSPYLHPNPSNFPFWNFHWWLVLLNIFLSVLLHPPGMPTTWTLGWLVIQCDEHPCILHAPQRLPRVSVVLGDTLRLTRCFGPKGDGGFCYVPGSLPNYRNRITFQCGLSKCSRKHKVNRKKSRCLVLEVTGRLGTSHGPILSVIQGKDNLHSA